MRHILLAATALAMLSGAAYAQSSTSGSASTTTVDTQSGSQSQSISNPRVNVIGNPIGNGASSSYSGSQSASNSHSNSRSAAVGNTTNVTIDTYAGGDGSGNSRSGSSSGRSGGSGGAASSGSAGSGTAGTGTAGSGTAGSTDQVNYSGSYTVRNTPEVIPPNVVGGNPCAIGASGGMAVAGFGIAAGGTWADKQCERRQQAALLFNIGEQTAAVELMCQDNNVRNALRVAGEPCRADAPAAAAAAVAPVATPAPAAKPARPDWCYTASTAELRRHAECDVKS